MRLLGKRAMARAGLVIAAACLQPGVSAGAEAGVRPESGEAEAPRAAIESPPAPIPAFKLASVTYLTSRSVYVDAGSEDGIETGQSLEVMRGGVVVATLTVDYVSSRRSSCSAEAGLAGIAVGDAVRFVPRSLPQSKPAGTVAGASPVSSGAATMRSRAREFGLRGRVGVRYLSVKDRSGAGDSLSQPALDLRLEGRRMGGSPVDLEIDVRSRQTYRTDLSGGTESEARTNVYRLASSVQAKGSPWRVTAGRQLSPALASVSIFDGVQCEYRERRWSLGAFSGTQPDPLDLGYSSAVREHGGYVEWRNAAEARRRWTFTTGLIGSYEEGEISREFSYLQGAFDGPRLSLWLTEEVDLNRGWKSEMENGSVSLTSTFVSVRFKANEVLYLRTGYDNRRNVRLYRDRLTPETEFDDQYRNGLWGGVEMRLARHFRAGVDLKSSGGGDLGGADSWTLTSGLYGLTRSAVYVSSRSTRYTNQRVEGWLHSLGLGLSMGSRWHAEATGGLREETSRIGLPVSEQVTWYGLEIDLSLGRGWFLTTSAERSDGEAESLEQIYSSVTWRF